MTNNCIGESQCQGFGAPAPRAWDHYEAGCIATYGGGHRGERLEAFQHGMSTVFNLLRSEFPDATTCKASADLLEVCKEALSYFSSDYLPLELFDCIRAAINKAEPGAK